ncbi:MAG TPA: FliM/FliN family flagellar motor switch protein [Chromobacteriaceae bacterium]|nr:FliM/FliN family flagellar motor switch protein [Chromobacteriaceae bacterium]
MPKSKIISASQTGNLTVLDPCLLGRPTHQLDRFGIQLQETLQHFFSLRFNRRYGATFRVTDVALHTDGPLAEARLWRSYLDPVGRIACALDRALLLTALDYRYGGRHRAAIPSKPIDTSIPETETEQRFTSMLAKGMLGEIASCVDRLHYGNDHPVRGDLAAVQLVAPSQQGPIVRIGLEEEAHRVVGELWLALDAGWMAHLLAGLGQRSLPVSATANEPVPLATQLPIKLTARQLEMSVPFGTVLDLKPGDVIPVRVSEQVAVLVGDSHLFHATVAEDSGKLWLTSFEDVE